jgi:hypothetical protein
MYIPTVRLFQKVEHVIHASKMIVRQDRRLRIIVLLYEPLRVGNHSAIRWTTQEVGEWEGTRGAIWLKVVERDR